MISSCPDASPLWKRFASDELIRQITRISDPMQLSSDANVTDPMQMSLWKREAFFLSLLGGAA